MTVSDEFLDHLDHPKTPVVLLKAGPFWEDELIGSAIGLLKFAIGGFLFGFFLRPGLELWAWLFQ